MRLDLHLDLKTSAMRRDAKQVRGVSLAGIPEEGRYVETRITRNVSAFILSTRVYNNCF